MWASSPRVAGSKDQDIESGDIATSECLRLQESLSTEEFSSLGVAGWIPGESSACSPRGVKASGLDSRAGRTALQLEMRGQAECSSTDPGQRPARARGGRVSILRWGGQGEESATLNPSKAGPQYMKPMSPTPTPLV